MSILRCRSANRRPRPSEWESTTRLWVAIRITRHAVVGLLEMRRRAELTSITGQRNTLHHRPPAGAGAGPLCIAWLVRKRKLFAREALIAPPTIDTMPLATIDAFAAHGIVAGDTAKQNVDQAYRAIKRLDAIGIDMEVVTAKLLVDGLRVFAESYEGAVQVIASKADAMRAGREPIVEDR